MAEASITGLVPYIYNAKIVRVIDGDTIEVDTDLGDGIWKHKEKIRLYGVDAPELRGPAKEAGLEAKEWMATKLVPGTMVLIRSIEKPEKFGRRLASMWVPGDAETISAQLIKAGLARSYFGGTHGPA